MKLSLKILIFFPFCLPIAGLSQKVQTDMTHELEKLFGRLIVNYDDVARKRINDSIRTLVSDYAKSDSVFDHRFKTLKYLGQVISTDSLVKVITWNLFLSEEPGKYYCYLIRKQGNNEKNRVYELSASYNMQPMKTDTIYGAHDWYGALYYEIRPFSEDKNSYILLGIDFGNPEVTRKLIDVLNVKSDGSLSFGKKIFLSDVTKSYRVVFEYVSNATMSLRFRSDSSVVFDHLVPFSLSHGSDRTGYGPEYSYDAYTLKDGLWKLFLNIDVRNKE